MRRLTLVLAAIWFSFSGPGGPALAQTTDLQAGVYIDQLTGFSVIWDPSTFAGELSGVGGIHLAGDRTHGDVFTSTAVSGSECVSQRSITERLSVADWAEELALPIWPAGTTAHDFVSTADLEIVVIACVPVGNPATATTFVLFDIRGTGLDTDWPATVAGWQPVIDSLILPDPLSLTTTGISDGQYTDPLFNWSVRFDPARYEAQYAGGSADSAFLSGVFLYAETDGESGGIWAERHEDIVACLEAQTLVNSSFPGFVAVEDPDFTPFAADGREAVLNQFEIEGGVRYVAYAGCQPMLLAGEPIAETFLVTSFSVNADAYPNSAALWQVMLDSIQFGDPAGATPTA